MPDQFDVIIAGGGVIGASIAWRLARDNFGVLLLDAGKIGSEASSAAAGMLSPSGEFDDPAMRELAAGSLAKYPEFVAELQADSGLPVDFRHTNAVEIALTPAGLQPRRPLATAKVLNSAELRALVPLARPDAIGAIHYSGEAIIDAAGLMQALRAACLARGVSIQEDSRVTRIAAGATSVQVTLAHAIMEAPCAVLAAGAWSGGIEVLIEGLPYALPRTFPVKGHLLGYRLPPGSLAATVRHDHTYVLQRSDGFTIAGSSTEDAGYNRTIDPQIVSDLTARAAALLPALAALEPECVWTGLRPATDGSAPHIGRVGPSPLWLAYGHYRNGILLAPATSTRICRELAAALE
jgi:glycine oxidase